MATHRIPILGASSLPDASGNVFFQPLALLASNDRWNPLVGVFNDTSSRDGLHGLFAAPHNYAGVPKIVLVWSAAVTSGSVVWDVDYRAVGGDNLESLDQTGQQESLSVVDAAPTAAWNRQEASVSLTAGNLMAGDIVEFALFRDGTDALDTMAAQAVLFDLLFEYSD